MRAHPMQFAFVALASFGCGDPYESNPINLHVSVSTIGVDHDDSYAVRVGDGPSRAIRSSLVLFLPPGEHDVVLDGIAVNCSVEGPDSIRITVAMDQVAEAAFEVACRALTGAIEVAVPTSGRDFDPDGYAVLVNGAPTTRVYPGGAVVIEGLTPGSHLVTLADFTLNCSLNGPASRMVMVTAGGLIRDTVRVAFEGGCQAVTGDVDIFATTGGVDRDPDGYTVTFDGRLEIEPCGWYDYDCVPGAPLMLAPNGSLSFYSVPPGDHTYEIGDIAPNCTVIDGASRTVSVVAGEIAEIRFDVTCQGP